MQTNYETQANEFLHQTNTEFKVEFLKHDFHFEGDKEKRDIYRITLTRGKRKYSFNFGQSINASDKYIVYNNPQYRSQTRIAGQDCELNKNFDSPSAYDVLACLQKYEVGTFKNFCDDFGYDEDSRRAEKTYKAVCEEYKSLCTLYTDKELEKMQEIQ